MALEWNYFAGFSYRVLDLQSEEEVRCCLSGTKLVLMKNGVMVVLSVKLCTFLWSLYVYSHGNAYL